MEDINKQGGDNNESSHHTAWNMPGQRPETGPVQPQKPQVPAPVEQPVSAVKQEPAEIEPQAQPETEKPAIVEVADKEAAQLMEQAMGHLIPPSSQPGQTEQGIERLLAGVRFRDRCKTYNCVCLAVLPEEGQFVIVDTSEGPEYGQVARGPKTVTDHKHVNFYKINRIATAEDALKFKENIEKEKEAYKICLQKITEKKLEMKLVEADYTFDRSKIIFYFTAEKRVDFRDLVKDLAYALKTRIDMRQIGVRDEAKMLGGYGCCGRELCCVTHLRDFIPVTIRMAKEQNLPLNPAKISGMCGRLMCCLSYEHEMYRQLKEANKNVKPAEEKPKEDTLIPATADVPGESDPSGKVTIPVWVDKPPVTPAVQARRPDNRSGQSRSGSSENRNSENRGNQSQGRRDENRNRGNNSNRGRNNRDNRRPDNRNRPQQGNAATPPAVGPEKPQAPQLPQNSEKKEPVQ